MVNRTYADVVSYSDYYPFGMLMPNRHGSDASPNDQYKYSFQNQEEDNEVYGTKGTFINYKYRGADTRIGRFFAVDPLTADYPHYTPYSFSGNKVIHAVELEGLEESVLNTVNKALSTFMDMFTPEDQLGTYQDNYKRDAEKVVQTATNTAKKAASAIPKVEVTSSVQIEFSLTVGAQGSFKLGKVGNSVNGGSVPISQAIYTYDFITETGTWQAFGQGGEELQPNITQEVGAAADAYIASVGASYSREVLIKKTVQETVKANAVKSESVTFGGSIGPAGVTYTGKVNYGENKKIESVSLTGGVNVSGNIAAGVGINTSISYDAGVTVTLQDSENCTDTCTED